ncbi:hypothetical protein H5410_050770 [Solanum commersonii]|uniref:Uncharacterized protein n=1 Tax=Solanum commersonii TaxID=4109 RepID=A0A9J5WXQ9_SOLCO|nr:hypothetical protein H5410_050770 [Solanum commersonii]
MTMLKASAKRRRTTPKAESPNWERIKVGTPEDMRKVSTHAINRGVGIKRNNNMVVTPHNSSLRMSPPEVGP